jgi:hypothetical protein
MQSLTNSVMLRLDALASCIVCNRCCNPSQAATSALCSPGSVPDFCAAASAAASCLASWCRSNWERSEAGEWKEGEATREMDTFLNLVGETVRYTG